MEDWVLKLNWRLSFYYQIMVVRNAWKKPCTEGAVYDLLHESIALTMIWGF